MPFTQEKMPCCPCPVNTKAWPWTLLWKGHSNVPLVSGTSSWGKCQFVLEPCKGHHSKSTGMEAIAMCAIGYFKNCNVSKVYPSFLEVIVHNYWHLTCYYSVFIDHSRNLRWFDHLWRLPVLSDTYRISFNWILLFTAQNFPVHRAVFTSLYS